MNQGVNDVSKRLCEIRTELDYIQKAFAESLDMSPTAYNNYETGRSGIPDDVLQKLALRHNVNLNYLLTGVGERFGGNVPLLNGEVVAVEITDLKVSAGAGILNGEIEKLGKFFIERAYLAPYSPKKVKGCFAKGDSMAPTIFNKDILFYVPGLIEDNGVYMIDVMGELRCKRIEFMLNGDRKVISDNPRYGTETFSKDDETIRIYAKVIGWFHLLRD